MAKRFSFNLAHLGAILALLLAACATPPSETVEPQPRVEETVLAPVISFPDVPFKEPPPPEPALEIVPLQLPVVDARAQRVLLGHLLPAGIRERELWKRDILAAFSALELTPSPENLCAVIAVIEQESSWQADPVVPGLGRLVWKEIEKRASAYHVPMFMIEVALQKTSADGRSYAQRIDALRTEKQMNRLFEDMSSAVGSISPSLRMDNPIRTGGPMQVSIAFAEAHRRAWPWPYATNASVRREVFTRRGGVYFGIANLLQYPVRYQQMKYRFADYNAGRYSSRNAAFQAALARISHRHVELDGDLLIYANGVPARRRSVTQHEVLRMTALLGLTERSAMADLTHEKTMAFEQTGIYRAVFAYAEKEAGKALPRALMPQIRLKGPKIRRQLTTEWFANRVDGRYRQCLKRQPLPP